MNITEAAKLLEKNKKIRRKNWAKNWYIYDYSDLIKDWRDEETELSLCDLLAEDWEEYKEKCNKLHTFEEALEAFKRGETIKRDLWRLVDSKKELSKKVYSEYSIMFTIDDFEANDWIILENKGE